MRKRVLVAEAADAVRQVVEAVLRQSGYDVIAVSSSAKASEVMQFSRPDLIVAGGDLVDAGRQAFYDQVQTNPQTSSIPLLVIEPADKSAVGLPPEVIISRPIDPRDFAQRVGIFLGEAGAAAPKGQSASKAEDHLLDEALGLDRLDVMHSEDMDKTGSLRSPGGKPDRTAVTPYDHSEEDESMNESRRVEFLQVREDATDIKPQTARVPAKKDEATGSGKLEIMRDQYGISDPAAFQIKPEQKAHDYDWFVDAVRNDVAGAAPDKTTAPAASDSASIIDPITAAATPVRSYPGGGRTAPRGNTEGVEKFIDEFKREIELLRAREPEPGPVPVIPKNVPAQKSLSWEEQVEALSADHVRLFKREFTAQLAARLAERIAGKIDPDKLLNLLKEEIMAAARKQQPGKR